MCAEWIKKWLKEQTSFEGRYAHLKIIAFLVLQHRGISGFHNSLLTWDFKEGILVDLILGLVKMKSFIWLKGRRDVYPISRKRDRGAHLSRVRANIYPSVPAWHRCLHCWFWGNSAEFIGCGPSFAFLSLLAQPLCQTKEAEFSGWMKDAQVLQSKASPCFKKKKKSTFLRIENERISPWQTQLSEVRMGLNVG